MEGEKGRVRVREIGVVWGREKRRTDREGESHETVARASIRLCAKLAASVYAPSRQEVVGAERGSAERGERRRLLGWRDSYGEKVGWIRVRAKAWEGRGVAGKAAKRDSGEGMITGYHISGSLLRVLRFPPFLLFDDPSSSSPPSPRLPSVYPHLLRRSCSSSRHCTDRCRATSTSADSFCLFFFLLFAFRLLTLSLPASLFHTLLRPPFRLVPLPSLVLLFLRVLSIHLPHPIPPRSPFPHPLPLTNRLRRDVAQTERDNSVRVLPPPPLLLFLSLSFFFSTLALFFSFDYTRPLLFALRERHRAALSRGWGCAGCAVGTSNHAPWNRYIRVVFEGIAGYETFKTIVEARSIAPWLFMKMSRDTFVTEDRVHIIAFPEFVRQRMLGDVFQKRLRKFYAYIELDGLGIKRERNSK